MKQLILVLVSLFMLTISNAQNGGQSDANSSIKITFVGYTTHGKAIVKLTNKQNCWAKLRITATPESRTKWVSPLGSDTFHVTIPSNGKIRGKSETNCDCPDFGNVEIIVSPHSLPISSVSISATRVNAKTFKLNLALGQVDGVNNFVIVKIQPTASSEQQNIVIRIPDGKSNYTYVATLTYANKTWSVVNETK